MIYRNLNFYEYRIRIAYTLPFYASCAFYKFLYIKIFNN